MLNISTKLTMYEMMLFYNCALIKTNNQKLYNLECTETKIIESTKC